MTAIEDDSQPVRQELERVLASPRFSRNPRMSTFLRFVVDRHLSGRDEELKESLIAVEVFGRRPDYDPKLDSIVRTEAGRLRARLKDYYASEGRASAVVIDVPKGGYIPSFRVAEAVPDWQTPRLRRAIPWSWVAAAAILMLVPVLVRIASSETRGNPVAGAPTIRSIAVLPLRNASTDPDQEYLADGITTALTTELAHISAIRVIAPSSAMRYRATTEAASDIGRELRVDGLVEGTVQRVGDRVLITAQLIEVTTARLVWAQSYERNLGDLLALQSDITRSIASEIKLTVTPEEHAHLVTVRSVEPAAQEAYLRGLHAVDPEADALKALKLFGEANRIDPEFALPYARLANVYGVAINAGLISEQEGYPKWKAAANRAVQLDDTLAEAHQSLGGILQYHDWNWHDAEKEYVRAVELNPNLAIAHLWYADLLQTLGRGDDALRHVKLAVQLDPYDLFTNASLAQILREDGRTRDAIEQAQRMIRERIDPEGVIAHWQTGLALEQQGKYDQAISEIEQADTLHDAIGKAFPNTDDERQADLAHVFAMSGKREPAVRILEQLHKTAHARPVRGWAFAVIYAALDDDDAVFRHLNSDLTERPSEMPSLRLDPRMARLRSDPRFTELLRRMGL
jgi:TolB-like protein/Flp pilus assembly protein TadD